MRTPRWRGRGRGQWAAGRQQPAAGACDEAGWRQQGACGEGSAHGPKPPMPPVKQAATLPTPCARAWQAAHARTGGRGGTGGEGGDGGWGGDGSGAGGGGGEGSGGDGLGGGGEGVGEGGEGGGRGGEGGAGTTKNVRAWLSVKRPLLAATRVPSGSRSESGESAGWAHEPGHPTGSAGRSTPAPSHTSELITASIITAPRASKVLSKTACSTTCGDCVGAGSAGLVERRTTRGKRSAGVQQAPGGGWQRGGSHVSSEVPVTK